MIEWKINALRPSCKNETASALNIYPKLQAVKLYIRIDNTDFRLDVGYLLIKYISFSGNSLCCYLY